MNSQESLNLSNTGAAAVLIGDPAKFGRVAEDGTVYVITPTGDRAVGSYPGKSPEEALAYFVKNLKWWLQRLRYLRREFDQVQWYQAMLMKQLINLETKSKN